MIKLKTTCNTFTHNFSSEPSAQFILVIFFFLCSLHISKYNVHILQLNGDFMNERVPSSLFFGFQKSDVLCFMRCA